jgi:transposase-like protein
MARSRREVWVGRVERWIASGQSARAFAAQIGVNANTLANWRWKLRESEVSRESSVAPTAMAFVEVDGGTLAARDERLEIVLAGGQVVRVPRDFDSSSVARLLDLLEQRR